MKKTNIYRDKGIVINNLKLINELYTEISAGTIKLRIQNGVLVQIDKTKIIKFL